MRTSTYDAILPAGGRIDSDFANQVGTAAKALIALGEETILSRTIRSLRDAGEVGRIVVIGGSDVRNVALEHGVEVAEEGTSGPENILRGLKHLLRSANPPSQVLVVTTDLPFLSPPMIRDFIDRCPAGMDICVPIIRKSDFQARFPNTTSTYVPLEGEHWTLGGMYLIDVDALQRAMPQIEKVFKNRKSVLGMAKLLGPVFLWKFLRKSLTVADIEAKIRTMLGCTGTAVLGAAPELAYDIDALDDYEYARDHPE